MSTRRIRGQWLFTDITVFTGTGNYAAAPNEAGVYIKKTVGAATTVTLPAISGNDTRFYWVKDAKGDAGTNNITVQGAAGATIDGQSSHILSNNYGSALYSYNPTTGEWSLIDSRATQAAQFNTGALASATFAAGQLTGAPFTVYSNTAATPGTLTTRTAAQMFSDFGNQSPGQQYLLRILNFGTSTLTIGAGTGVTLLGAMTIPTTTWREFIVTFTTASALTIQAVGAGTT